MTTAARMPSTAPSVPSTALPLELTLAQTKSAVSTPSRPTLTTPSDHDRGRGAGDRAVELALQFALEVTGVPRHPEDHPGDDADGDDREAAAEDLLRLEAQAVRPEGEDAPTPSEMSDRAGDADPELRQHVAAADLVEVGDEDADDEAGFEAFAQADEEVGEHGMLSGRGTGYCLVRLPLLIPPYAGRAIVSNGGDRDGAHAHAARTGPPSALERSRRACSRSSSVGSSSASSPPSPTGSSLPWGLIAGLAIVAALVAGFRLVFDSRTHRRGRRPRRAGAPAVLALPGAGGTGARRSTIPIGCDLGDRADRDRGGHRRVAECVAAVAGRREASASE